MCSCACTFCLQRQIEVVEQKPDIPAVMLLLLQEVLVKELPLEYNKEDLLNPCFVVFGKRRQ